MIVALVNETCALIKEIGTRETNKKEVDSINRTHDILIELKANADQLKTGVQLLSARLPEGEVEEIVKTGITCADRIGRNQEAFQHDLNQKLFLQNIQKNVQKALDDVQKAWKSYVDEHKGDPLALYHLVEQLPEVKRQSATYEKLAADLEKFGRRLPDSPAKLQAFDQALELLTHMLGEVEGLSPEVQRFLIELSSNGQVSLGEVTDEVLTWCRVPERAQVFSLQYKN